MSPEQIAQRLRRIATAIDNSKKPSRALVAEAIRTVIAELDPARIDRMVQQDERVDDMLALDDIKLEEMIKSLEATLETLKAAKKPAAA